MAKKIIVTNPTPVRKCKRMDIEVVNRDEMHASQRRNSKYRPLLDAIEQLNPDEKAVAVPYDNPKHLNSMRTAVYQYSYKNDIKVKSRRDAEKQKVYFYRAK